MNKVLRTAVAAMVLAVLGLALWILYPLLVGLAGGYEAAVRSGRKEIDFVAQFAEVFPESEHAISHYTGHAGAPSWHSTVGLHGRYLLGVQVDIQFDVTRTRVVGWKEPVFVLDEVSSVQGRMVTFNPPSHRTFGLAQWKKLYESGGDLSVLGIRAIKDKPIAGFEPLWKHGQ